MAPTDSVRFPDLKIKGEPQDVKPLAGYHLLTIQPDKIRENTPYVSVSEWLRQFFANSAGAEAKNIVIQGQRSGQILMLDYQDDGISMPYNTHVEVYGQGASADRNRPYSRKGTGMKVALCRNTDVTISFASVARGDAAGGSETDATDRSLVYFAPTFCEGKVAGYIYLELPADFHGTTLLDYVAYIKNRASDENKAGDTIAAAQKAAYNLLRGGLNHIGHSNAPFEDFAELMSYLEGRLLSPVGSGTRFLMWVFNEVACRIQEAQNPKRGNSKDLIYHGFQGARSNFFFTDCAAKLFLGSDLLALLLPGAQPRPPINVTVCDAEVVVRSDTTPACQGVAEVVGERRPLKTESGEVYAWYIKYNHSPDDNGKFARDKGAMLVQDQDYIMTDGFTDLAPAKLRSSQDAVMTQAQRGIQDKLPKMYEMLRSLLEWREGEEPMSKEELFAFAAQRRETGRGVQVDSRIIMQLAGAYRFVVLFTGEGGIEYDATKQALIPDCCYNMWRDLLQDSAAEVIARMRAQLPAKVKEERAFAEASGVPATPAQGNSAEGQAAGGAGPSSTPGTAGTTGAGPSAAAQPTGANAVRSSRRKRGLEADYDAALAILSMSVPGSSASGGSGGGGGEEGAGAIGGSTAAAPLQDNAGASQPSGGAAALPCAGNAIGGPAPQALGAAGRLQGASGSGAGAGGSGVPPAGDGSGAGPSRRRRSGAAGRDSNAGGDDSDFVATDSDEVEADEDEERPRKRVNAGKRQRLATFLKKWDARYAAATAASNHAAVQGLAAALRAVVGQLKGNQMVDG